MLNLRNLLLFGSTQSSAIVLEGEARLDGMIVEDCSTQLNWLSEAGLDSFGNPLPTLC